MKNLLCFSLLWFLFSSLNIMAEDLGVKLPVDTTKLYSLELKDGNVLNGQVVVADSSMLQFKSGSLSVFEIKLDEIVSLKEVKPSTGRSRYWFENPNATRYLFGPSAYNLAPGEGYYQNTYLVLNSFNLGVLKNFTFGGGIELISTFSVDGAGPIFFLTPKYVFELNSKWHAGVGLFYVSTPNIDDDETEDNNSSKRSDLGIGYGIVTYGSENNNITAGLGWGFFDGETSDSPIITISATRRISKKMALVTENWLITSVDGMNIYSYGIRFFGEKIAVDLAFLNNLDIMQAIIIGIPYVDFVVKF